MDVEVDADGDAVHVAGNICETIIFPADAIQPKEMPEYADVDGRTESDVDFIELNPMTSLNDSDQLNENNLNTTNDFDNNKSVNANNNSFESEQATEDDKQSPSREKDAPADYIDDETVEEEQREDYDIICDAVKEEQNELQNMDKIMAEVDDEEIEEEEEELVEEEEEGDNDNEEIITNDIPVPNIVERTAARKQESVNENQCRVCKTTTEDLVSLFKKIDNLTAADMLMIISPNAFIAEKDYMPQFICDNCLDNVTIAVQLKHQFEATETELRKNLSRSKNKMRRPRGYVVIDAPDSDPQSDDEEPNDDVEFKVSEEEISSADSDSEDSDISNKRKRTSRGSGGQRGRRKAQQSIGMTKAIKRELNAETDDNFNNDSSAGKKRRTPNYSFVQQDDDLTCEVCNKQFKIKKAFETHRSKHIGCSECNDIFKTRTELQRHIAQEHDQSKTLYECKKCHRAYQSRSKLKQHINEQCGSKRKRNPEYHSMTMGSDLFKSVAPLTTTYWSDSFSD